MYVGLREAATRHSLLRVGRRTPFRMPVKHAELKSFQIAPFSSFPHDSGPITVSTVAPFFAGIYDFRRIVRLVQTRLQRLQRGVGGPHECAARTVSGFDGIHTGLFADPIVVLRLALQAFRRPPAMLDKARRSPPGPITGFRSRGGLARKSAPFPGDNQP